MLGKKSGTYDEPDVGKPIKVSCRGGDERTISYITILLPIPPITSPQIKRPQNIIPNLATSDLDQ